jgi:hypothetical protein
MSRMRWSKIYPRAWQKQFGAEFDALNEMKPVGPRDVFDVVFHAVSAHLATIGRLWLFALCWATVAFFNVIAKEVQWPAGLLVLSCMILAIISPRAWFKNSLAMFTAIPISSLYFYQVPGIHHEPLYKTAVALIPALIGAIIGLALRASWDLSTPEKSR